MLHVWEARLDAPGWPACAGRHPAKIELHLGEAIAKCHGVGVWAPLRDAPVAVEAIEAIEGYAAALAVSGAALPPLRRFEATAPASALSPRLCPQ